ncbi:DUF2842 domain-containing protein [Sulfitobacter sp. M57]|uniref:DUF2842 domain-containing protein n=1 Tax=unclassified Sulfitobacter TaxID=196795 RepID=UPI0023E1B5B9|nr:MULTISPECIES: DUF2842 domain-containing protein [unclassified Sulfitobacter]MDF3414240.1 DUF2842 domain-containing protein [Sulfitobacter sp. KE5]MDF3420478.1 DUF2842 domain-containing protein [Sulfitobacter sp. KE43]MDF3432786.1 DUF2842 domain-containing protein [Sulfitobacter sp. KE42]MDF3458426.1 DUF2842 domain-containing protein [Sulfitobacter sp. S74]MDF3462326.1 DUF2842 domain-containing protein [Sulfitobacter sp. Ks18]
MALSYKARRRWSLVILLVAMPLYVIVALNIVALFERPSMLVELLIYVGLGVAWVLPLKSIFKGVGQADPDAKSDDSSRLD